MRILRSEPLVRGVWTDLEVPGFDLRGAMYHYGDGCPDLIELADGSVLVAVEVFGPWGER